MEIRITDDKVGVESSAGETSSDGSGEVDVLKWVFCTSSILGDCDGAMNGWRELAWQSELGAAISSDMLPLAIEDDRG